MSNVTFINMQIQNWHIQVEKRINLNMNNVSILFIFNFFYDFYGKNYDKIIVSRAVCGEHSKQKIKDEAKTTWNYSKVSWS